MALSFASLLYRLRRRMVSSKSCNHAYACAAGELHRLGCSNELCPACGKSLPSCGCITDPTTQHLVRKTYTADGLVTCFIDVYAPADSDFEEIVDGVLLDGDLDARVEG